MLQKMNKDEIGKRENVHIFQYALNPGGIVTLEVGAFFLLMGAVIVYPITHFDPISWIALSVICIILAVVALSMAQYWRAYIKKSFLAYDNEFLFVANQSDNAVCIPWKDMDEKNSGLDTQKGGKLVMTFDGESIPVRISTNIVAIPQYETVIYTILRHIKKNEGK